MQAHIVGYVFPNLQNDLKTQTRGEENVKFKCQEGKSPLPLPPLWSLWGGRIEKLNDAALWFETGDAEYEFFIGLVTESWNAWLFNRAFYRNTREVISPTLELLCYGSLPWLYRHMQ